MRRSTTTVGLSLLAATASLALAGAASAATRAVHPGQSIQRAIDRSHPGDTVLVKRGTYHQSLQISTDRLTLRGEDATLAAPRHPANTLCNQMGATTGICVVGQIGPPSGSDSPPTVQRPVRRVTISRLAVRDFPGDGVFAFGSRDLHALHDRFLGNGGYGIFSNTSSGTHDIDDLSRGNGDAGFYVGDSPHADALVQGNRSISNHGEGVFLRDASYGTVRGNLVRGNCVGIEVLAGAPGPAGHWTITHNRAIANNKGCKGQSSEGEPPQSGIGIALLGAARSSVSENRVFGQRHLHPSFASAGIVVGRGADGTPSRRDTITRNVVLHNHPHDLRWDRSGSVGFARNRCQTSLPRGLCPRPARFTG